MKKCLILHWWWWNSNQNWFPWLEMNLYKLNINTFIPDLPNTSFPVYHEQIKTLEKYMDFFKSGDIIIWHSLGCKLALHFIEKYKLKWLTVILVAPAYAWLWEELWRKALWVAYDNLTQYFNEELSFEKLWNKYITFLSNDDPFINMWSAKNYLKQLEKVEFIDFEKKWHFNQSAWIFEIPEILDYIN